MFFALCVVVPSQLVAYFFFIKTELKSFTLFCKNRDSLTVSSVPRGHWTGKAQELHIP